jgi:DNA-binding CsgD family transcriptional regulator
VALARGWTVVLVDVQEVGGTPEALLVALGGRGAEDLIAALGQNHLFLLIDAVEAHTALSHFVFGTLLQRLPAHTQVVVAGREALAPHGEAGDLWRPVIEHMPLEALLPTEAQVFLRRGGLTDERVRANIIRLADGYPLALSLALSLAVRRGTRDVASSPEWRLIIRELAERLLDEMEDPAVRPLVSACAVIGRFDESTLTAVSGGVHGAAIFNRLCRLSIMRPTRRGIIVQPEARRILAQDLRWRRFDEYQALRQWARAHRASRTRPPEHPPSRLPERPKCRVPLVPGPIPVPSRWPLGHGGQGPTFTELTTKVTLLPDERSLPALVNQLTPREREVLDVLASGQRSSREIAARLVITLGTANLHVKHILHKLGFVNRAELAIWWMQRDWVDRSSAAGQLS